MTSPRVRATDFSARLHHPLVMRVRDSFRSVVIRCLACMGISLLCGAVDLAGAQEFREVRMDVAIRTGTILGSVARLRAWVLPGNGERPMAERGLYRNEAGETVMEVWRMNGRLPALLPGDGWVTGTGARAPAGIAAVPVLAWRASPSGITLAVPSGDWTDPATGESWWLLFRFTGNTGVPPARMVQSFLAAREDLLLRDSRHKGVVFFPPFTGTRE